MRLSVCAVLTGLMGGLSLEWLGLSGRHPSGPYLSASDPALLCPWAPSHLSYLGGSGLLCPSPVWALEQALSSQPSQLVHTTVSFPGPVSQARGLGTYREDISCTPGGHLPSAPFLANARARVPPRHIPGRRARRSEGSKFAAANYSWLQPTRCC